MKALEDLKAAYAAATQGEWKIERNQQDQCTLVVRDESLRSKVAVTHPTWLCEEHGGTTFDNSLLIALMHNALPALIECAEALEDCRDRLELLTESGRSKMLDAAAKQRAETALTKLEQTK